MSLGNVPNPGGKDANYSWQKSMALAMGQMLTLLQSVASGAWIKEVPSGAVDGMNTVFSIQNVPVTGSDMLFVSGQLLAGGGVDYTLSGKTFTLNVAPTVGQSIFVFYQKS